MTTARFKPECTRCGYDLSGLHLRSGVVICPECSRSFDEAELRAAIRFPGFTGALLLMAGPAILLALAAAVVKVLVGWGGAWATLAFLSIASAAVIPPVVMDRRRQSFPLRGFAIADGLLTGVGAAFVGACTILLASAFL